MALVGVLVTQIITSSGNLPSTPSVGTVIYWTGAGNPVGYYVWNGSDWYQLELISE